MRQVVGELGVVLDGHGEVSVCAVALQIERGHDHRGHASLRRYRRGADVRPSHADGPVASARPDRAPGLSRHVQPSRGAQLPDVHEPEQGVDIGLVELDGSAHEALERFLLSQHGRRDPHRPERLEREADERARRVVREAPVVLLDQDGRGVHVLLERLGIPCKRRKPFAEMLVAVAVAAAAAAAAAVAVAVADFDEEKRGVPVDSHADGASHRVHSKRVDRVLGGLLLRSFVLSLFLFLFLSLFLFLIAFHLIARMPTRDLDQDVTAAGVAFCIPEPGLGEDIMSGGQ